jgi:hypothetical protein
MKVVKLDARSLLAGGLVGSLAAGVCGYLLGRSRARREYEARLDTAVAEVKAHYARPIIPRVDEADITQLGARRNTWAAVVKATFPDTRKPIPDPLAGLDDGSVDEESADEDHGGDREGADAEGSGRLQEVGSGAPGPVEDGEPDRPFEIPEAAFGELADEGFQQISVTYYQADRTLCDDKDGPIRDVVGTIGTADPSGLDPELSGDPHIRYVRNRRLEVDFEILLDARSFAETVLGYGQPNRRREASPAAAKSAE